MDVANAAEGLNLVPDQIGDRCQKLFQDFLNEWTEGGDEPKYLAEAKELVKPERNTLQVSMKDVERFNANLHQTIMEEYYRVYPYLCNAVRNFVKDRAEVAQDKEFYVSLTDVDVALKVRELKTLKIGTLTKITGQVVRTHPVHPELVSGTFTCLDCHTLVPDVEQQFKFTQPSICKNPVCNNRSRFMLEINKSRFVDFQKIRIQEVQAELPRGCIPRSVEIILRAEAVESAHAGDRCEFTGTLIVVPDVGALNVGVNKESDSRHKGQGDNSEGVRGLKSLGVRDLHYRMAFLACGVQSAHKNRLSGCDDDEMETPEEMKAKMSAEEWEVIYNMTNNRNLYSDLITSMFPTIHGNDEVKRGIMLMLFGGVPKTTPDESSLRGDINLCVVGDPSTAKSQFLKMVADFCPRAVYTSGKASSAAGLTAAVVKDEESNEFVIEAGALMLADNGVCCIDEFDKMEEHDTVAIHEAMEQQTITITKAGVKATLNARASILAAANPIGGRYDRSKSLVQNIEMSAPIMSRFDLFFILVDDCNEVTDYAIARRIIDLHTHLSESVERIYTPEQIAQYINFARMFKPKISPESQDLLVEQYRKLRQRDTGGSASSSWKITVRQLESMLRLSEAFARMHCNDTVGIKHVKEAYRLLNKSIIRIDQPDVHLDEDEEEAQVEDAAEEQMEVEEQGDQANKKQMKLTYEEYKNMSNLIIMHMRQKEDSQESAASETASEDIKRSDVINWYLEEISGDIESQEELAEKKAVVEKVVDRLIYQDRVIIPLKQKAGLKSKTADDDGDEDPYLVVHPNYVIDI